MQQTACSDIRPGGGQRRPPAVDDSAAAQQPAPVVYGVHVHIERPPVQQAVRPVEPGVVQIVQRDDRGGGVRHGRRAGDRAVVQARVAGRVQALDERPDRGLDGDRACFCFLGL